MTEFRKGDRVKFHECCGLPSFTGHLATVAHDEPTSYGNIWIDLDDPVDGQTRWNTAPNTIEKLPRAFTRFKVNKKMFTDIDAAITYATSLKKTVQIKGLYG